MKYNFIYINICIQNKDKLIIVFIIKTNILKTIEQKKREQYKHNISSKCSYNSSKEHTTTVLRF